MVRGAVEGTIGALTCQNIELQVQVSMLESRCAILNEQFQVALARLTAMEQANVPPAD